MKNKFITTSLVAMAALVMLGAGCSSPTTNPAPTNVTNTNKTTNTASINDTNTADTTTVTFDDSATDSAILADTNGQWATTATASSEYGSDSWSANQATGKPNVTEFGDDGNAWAPYESAGGLETLELTYAKAVNAIGVRVRESYGNGTLTKIELKDTAGAYYKVWSGTDATDGLKYLQVGFAKTSYKVNGVKLTFDTGDLTTEWSEIDAVQLIGE